MYIIKKIKRVIELVTGVCPRCVLRYSALLFRTSYENFNSKENTRNSHDRPSYACGRLGDQALLEGDRAGASEILDVECAVHTGQ